MLGVNKSKTSDLFVDEDYFLPPESEPVKNLSDEQQFSSQQEYSQSTPILSNTIDEQANNAVKRCVDIFLNFDLLPDMCLVKNLKNGRICSKPQHLTEPNVVEICIEMDVEGFTAFEIANATFDENQRKTWQSEFDEVLELVQNYDEKTKTFVHITKKILVISSRLSTHAIRLAKVPFDEAVNLSSEYEE